MLVLAAALDVNFHPFGVPLVMTLPLESTGCMASVVLFTPVNVGANPAPRLLSVVAVHNKFAPLPVKLIVALLT
jgi:hypothetical protein